MSGEARAARPAKIRVNLRRAALVAALVTVLAVVFALSTNPEKVLTSSAGGPRILTAAEASTVPELAGVSDFDNTTP